MGGKQACEFRRIWKNSIRLTDSNHLLGVAANWDQWFGKFDPVKADVPGMKTRYKWPLASEPWTERVRASRHRTGRWTSLRCERQTGAEGSKPERL